MARCVARSPRHGAVESTESVRATHTAAQPVREFVLARAWDSSVGWSQSNRTLHVIGIDILAALADADPASMVEPARGHACRLHERAPIVVAGDALGRLAGADGFAGTLGDEFLDRGL